MTDKDARESSIFYMLGLTWDWPLWRLANFYAVSIDTFRLWLKEMDFKPKEIELLENREPYPDDCCIVCGIKTDKGFCSSECVDKGISSTKKLIKIMRDRLIPVTNFNNTYYDVINAKMVRNYEHS